MQLWESGGAGGVRTPGRSFSPYNGLANRRLQPLGHLSVANRRKHYSLQPHLVTVSLSIAALWCKLSPRCHQTLRVSQLRRALNRDLCAYNAWLRDSRTPKQLLHCHYIHASTHQTGSKRVSQRVVTPAIPAFLHG